MDNIKEKLNRIDEQLAGGYQQLYQQIITSSPLLFCAIGLIAGIVTQNTFDLSIFIWLILFVLCIAGLIAFIVISKIAQKHLSYALCTFACFACLGAIRLISFQQPPANDIRNFVGEERQLATIRGIISTEPYSAEPEWQFAKFSHTDPRCSFYLKLQEIETTDGWAKVKGTVRMQVNEPVLYLKAGDYIEAFCWFDKFKNATNPGQFDIAKYLARNNVYIAASVESRDSIVLLKNHGKAALPKIKQKLTEIAKVGLLDSPYAYEQNQKLLQALILGYRAEIDRDVYMAFRKTGLLHFVCLSGMNFAIVIGIVWWLCRIIGLLKPARAAICIFAAILFLLVVPPQPPAFRAAIMCFAFCASFFFQRHPNPLNSLSLAAIILLLINPMQLFEVDWQLSFAAVVGIIFFTDKVHFYLYQKLSDWFWVKRPSEIKPIFRMVARPGPILLNVFSISFAAWLATAGLSLYHFYTVNLLTSIWTVLVSPLIAVVSTLGYVKMTLALVLPKAASVLGVITLKLADLLIWVVKFIAGLCPSEILIGHVPALLIIFYYALLLFAGFVYFRRPLIKTAILAAMTLAIVCFLGITKYNRTHRDNLVITCLDVGQGQAIVTQFPGGNTYLFDAGSFDRSDIGTRIAAPFLSYNGINKIDVIFISHSDIDHVNGIPEIIQSCKVSGIYANETFFEEQKPTAKFLNDWLSAKKRRIHSVKNDIFTGIEIIWPNENARADSQMSENDKSLVTLIEFADVKVLLCSDIEKTAQKELLRLFPSLSPEIIVVPHHGSLRTRLPGFLESLNADIFVYSCSEKQYERYKTNEQNSHVKSFYTGKVGAVTITIDKNGKIKAPVFESGALNTKR